MSGKFFVTPIALLIAFTIGCMVARHDPNIFPRPGAEARLEERIWLNSRGRPYAIAIGVLNAVVLFGIGIMGIGLASYFGHFIQKEHLMRDLRPFLAVLMVAFAASHFLKEVVSHLFRKEQAQPWVRHLAFGVYAMLLIVPVVTAASGLGA
jgi:hypothetical protein